MNALTLVFFLLVLEYVLVEVILQVFVGVINAKLFETGPKKKEEKEKRENASLMRNQSTTQRTNKPEPGRPIIECGSMTLLAVGRLCWCCRYFHSNNTEPVDVGKVLEAKDVEHADRVARVHLVRVLFGEQGVIQLQHDPVEERTVQALGYGVSGGYGLHRKPKKKNKKKKMVKTTGKGCSAMRNFIHYASGMR